MIKITKEDFEGYTLDTTVWKRNAGSAQARYYHDRIMGEQDVFNVPGSVPTIVPGNVMKGGDAHLNENPDNADFNRLKN